MKTKPILNDDLTGCESVSEYQVNIAREASALMSQLCGVELPPLGQLRRMSDAELLQLPGVGRRRVKVIRTALLFAEKAWWDNFHPLPRTYDSPEKFARHFAPLTSREQEEFWVADLNNVNAILGERMLCRGIETNCRLSMQTIFAPALRERAMKIIMVHNHPSGDNTPSPEDKALTSKIKQAGDIVGVLLLDHIIVSSNGYISFKEEHLL